MAKRPARPRAKMWKAAQKAAGNTMKMTSSRAMTGDVSNHWKGTMGPGGRGVGILASRYGTKMHAPIAKKTMSRKKLVAGMAKETNRLKRRGK